MSNICKDDFYLKLNEYIIAKLFENRNVSRQSYLGYLTITKVKSLFLGKNKTIL